MWYIFSRSCSGDCFWWWRGFSWFWHWIRNGGKWRAYCCIRKLLWRFVTFGIFQTFYVSKVIQKWSFLIDRSSWNITARGWIWCWIGRQDGSGQPTRFSLKNFPYYIKAWNRHIFNRLWIKSRDKSPCRA